MKDQYNSIYGDEERMIYDFNLNEGDTFDSMLSINIMEISFVEVDGKNEKVFFMLKTNIMALIHFSKEPVLYGAMENWAISICSPTGKWIGFAFQF